MSLLRAASATFARIDRHPVLPIERLFAIERVAAAIEGRRTPQVEPPSELVERLRAQGAAGLSVADLRRLLRGIWSDRSVAERAVSVIEHAVAADRRSLDRAIVEAYLSRYPADHRAFAALREAAALVAGRHAWRWRTNGERWRLWDGPAAFGEALRRATDPAALCREAGFAGRLADGAFVSAARANAARSAR